MPDFTQWWRGLSETSRVTLLTTLLSSFLLMLGWSGSRVIKLASKKISESRRAKAAERLHQLSLHVWGFIKGISGGGTRGIPTSLIAHQFNLSDDRAKQVLRYIRDRGLLAPNFDESLWFSDPETRFFN
jgi:hypothetical protein